MKLQFNIFNLGYFLKNKKLENIKLISLHRRKKIQNKILTPTQIKTKTTFLFILTPKLQMQTEQKENQQKKKEKKNI
ncbi:hypothetical protein BpHYR1_020551 [Brachionus plicatilis]|uniref:Uncharacterized protein n=1 Tax=Brachionus plicatilis TaxID=10195 RepID=A0A3M7S7X5_BRAPC|nr:hypothetical protein BpHYR1_020551 [Brachionus plicatilis]